MRRDDGHGSLAGRQDGFTLIELMVTITVMGLLLLVAVPSFNNAMLGSKLSAFANSFTASAQLARSEAIKRNAAITMCASSDGATCAGAGGWQQGWIVFNDKDGDGTINGTETRVSYQQALPAGFSFSADNYTIVFDSSGVSGTSADLVLCRKDPVGSQERKLKLRAGRVSNEVTKNGVCP